MASVGPDAAADWAWARLAARGPYLVRKGAPAKDRSRHLTAFAETRQALQERLSKWVELGLIAPR